MLEELEVLNGTMSLKFDVLNTKYTVIMNNEDTSLDFQYKLKDGVNINIEGNENLEDNSNVIITVSNGKDSMSYYFTVYREIAEETNKTIADFIDLDITPKKEVSIYAGPGIACTCFLLILFLFTILFHKRKSK